jgi:hypothetical protein
MSKRARMAFNPVWRFHLLTGTRRFFFRRRASVLALSLAKANQWSRDKRFGVY